MPFLLVMTTNLGILPAAATFPLIAPSVLPETLDLGPRGCKKLCVIVQVHPPGHQACERHEARVLGSCFAVYVLNLENDARYSRGVCVCVCI